jgi:uncharacterized protein (TIGR02284 family)
MKVAELLDRLIAISVDGEKRYEHAAKDVERASLEAYFEWQAYNRKMAADELAAERRRLYGDGKEHGTVGGFVDREALDFSVIMSKGDTGVVEWCREDDAKVIAEYETALAGDLPDDLRLLLERQLERVRSAISNLEKVISMFGRPRS